MLKLVCITCGVTKEDNGIWRIKANKELDELTKHRNIINYVKAQMLSCFGHTNRIAEIGIVKIIYKWKQFTGKPVGRPRSRREDVRNDLKKDEIYKACRTNSRPPQTEGYF
jgi:hypothetical protein